MNRINFSSYISAEYSYWNRLVSPPWDEFKMVYRGISNNFCYNYEKSDMC